MNIPIYRAKKIQSDEYVVGYYTEKVKQYPGKHYIHFNNGYTETYERIDPTTLAIHFPDMLDSQGNKIFASLSNDGKGGDRLIKDGSYEDGFNAVFEPYFRKSSYSIFNLPQNPDGSYSLKRYKVIGIQE